MLVCFLSVPFMVEAQEILDSRSVSMIQGEDPFAEECGEVGNFCSPVWWVKATVDDVRKELENGASVNYINPQGMTPLLAAVVLNKDLKMLDLLIEKGADVNYRGKDGRLILENALHSNKEMVAFLIDKGAKVSPDIMAKYKVYENIEMLELLLAHGADINAKDKNGETILMNAVRRVGWDLDVDFIKKLLDHGAKADMKDRTGVTVLMVALEPVDVKEDLIELLLQRGATPTIDWEDGLGRTAWDLARTENVRQILRKYAKR